MTGKYLAVDVYADGARDYLSVVSIYTSGWGSLNDSQWPPNYVQSGFGAGKWVTLYFDLTTALGEGKDLTDVGIIKFCFDFETNAGTEQAVYLDNLRLVDEIPAEPEVTEAPTEPEVTEAPTEPQPQDENDLLANCSGIVYNKDHWAEGTGLTVAPDTENITGEGSIRSFAFTADETVSTTLAAAQFHLGQSYDMTGKNLAFDVKYVADTREQQQIGVRLHMNSWGNINDINRILKINPGDWRTVVVDFTSVINEGRDLSDLSLITFHFDFSNNTGVERTIYIDNVRLVTDEQTQLIEDPLPEPQDENDMLGQTENISYDKPHWENVDNGVDSDGNPIDDVTTGLTCGRDTDNITGEGSIRSWYFAATAEASFEHAVAQLRLGQSYDMTGKSLAFDVKFESGNADAVQYFSVNLHNSDWSDVVIARSVRVDQNNWQRVVLDFSESIISGKDLSDISFITFSFDFVSNTGAERTVYIDNVQLVDIENVNDDITNMTHDSGMTTAPVFFHTSDKTWGDDAQSLRVVTAAGANEITLHAQNAVEKGLLENYPDMSSCIVNGYFWFGDAEPFAELSITEGSWARSMYSPFSFEAVGDGWYYGTLNSHEIIYDDSDTQAGATSDQVLRLSLRLTENAIVYLDRFTVTQIDPEPVDPHDLLGDLKYFVYDKEDWGEEYGLGYGRNEEYLYGRESVRSWSFTATAAANAESAVAQFRLKKSHDMSDCTLLLDVYYASEGTAAQTIGVRMHNSNWGNINDVNRTFDVAPNAWTTIVVDFSSVLNAGADLTDLRFISFYFDFAETTGCERAVYIDNVRLYRSETVREDWINMSQDSGSYYKNTETNITNDVDAIKAEGSYQGLYVKSPADSVGKVTFNTDQAVIKGEIDALPDLISGTLSAWFYFGDAQPSAYVTLTEYGWKGSRGTHFTFGENRNGWYYGTLDCSTIGYSEIENPGLIRRITINLPAGYEGYIDGLTYTPDELPAKLRFSSANLRLYYDLSIGFKADAALFADGMFTDPYVTYEFNGQIYTITQYNVVNGRYEFLFEHLYPQEINDIMNVTLYANYNGTTYRSEPKVYSVAHYCYNLLDSSICAENPELSALLVDILNYGTEAQLAFGYNTESLANAKLTPEQAAMGTQTDPVTKSVTDTEYEVVDAPEATWMSATLVLEKSIGIRYCFYAENVEDLSVVVKSNGKTWTYTEFEPVAGIENQYYVYFNDINATQLSNIVYTTLFRGDAAVSNTLRYSVESYIHAFRDDAQYGKVVKAIMRYGVSAWNYVY